MVGNETQMRPLNQIVKGYNLEFNVSDPGSIEQPYEFINEIDLQFPSGKW